MTDEALTSQVDYYRRRAGEYDVTAYGDIAIAEIGDPDNGRTFDGKRSPLRQE